MSSGISSLWGTSSKSLKRLRFDGKSFDGQVTVTVRGMVIRTTVTETAVTLSVTLMVDLMSNGDGVASNVTVMKATSVGNGELVLKGFSKMVVDGSEDLSNGGEGGR